MRAAPTPLRHRSGAALAMALLAALTFGAPAGAAGEKGAQRAGATGTGTTGTGATGAGTAAAAGARELSPEQARAGAGAALAAGDARTARLLAEALLQRDPGDVYLLLLLSSAAYAEGDGQAAETAARRAWKAAGTEAERSRAARQIAFVAYREGRPTAAQWWLRRAVQAAPDAATRSQSLRDFRTVRAANPLWLRFDFGVSPSSNVNNGSSSDTLVLFGIPFLLSPDAKALSGIETRFGFSAAYRFAETEWRRSEVGLNFNARVYSLSGEARRKAPGADADDYAFTALETYALQRFIPQAAPYLQFDARLTAGHNWYGGADLSDYLRADFGNDWRLSPRDRLRFELGTERQWRIDTPLRSADAVTLGAEYTRQRERGGSWSLGIWTRETRSDSVEVDHRARGADARYSFARPILGAEVTARVSAERRDYDRSIYAAGGREDLRLGAGLDLFFRDVDYMGFAPQVGVSASRVRSSVDLYDSEEIGVTLGIRSAF